MEIIHVVLGQANPNRMNGVNKVVHELASQQALHGAKVSVWGITANSTHDYPERNFETRLFKAYTNKFKIDSQFTHAVAKVKQQAIFHIHGGFNPAFYSVSAILRKLRANYVFTPHGAYNVIAMQRSKWVKKLYYTLFEKALLKNAKTIHCLGQSEVDGLQTIYPAAKYSLVPYGFEVDNLPQATLSNKSYTIGFCGRIDIYTKGLDLLLTAFAQAKDNISNARLCIIGDGAELSTLKAQAASLGIADSVEFCGSLYGADKYKKLATCSVFAHPSRNEGLPSSVLEAAAMGLPCIVTQATNVGESIKRYHAGAVITRPDADALANAMVTVYQSNLAQLGENARHMVATEYNWEAIIGRFNMLYAA